MKGAPANTQSEERGFDLRGAGGEDGQFEAVDLLIATPLVKAEADVVGLTAEAAAATVADVRVTADADEIVEVLKVFGGFVAFDSSGVFTEELAREGEIAADAFTIGINHGKDEAVDIQDVGRRCDSAGQGFLCQLDLCRVDGAAKETEGGQNAGSRLLKVSRVMGVVKACGVARSWRFAVGGAAARWQAAWAAEQRAQGLRAAWAYPVPAQ